MEDTREVQIVFCPCGKNFRQAGQPNTNPTLKEKREMGQNVADGCKIEKITLSEFKRMNLDWCGASSESTCKPNDEEE